MPLHVILKARLFSQYFQTDTCAQDTHLLSFQRHQTLFTELLSHSPIVSIDFTDVTLVSEDTYGDNEVGGDEENYKGEEGERGEDGEEGDEDDDDDDDDDDDEDDEDGENDEDDKSYLMINANIQ